MLHLCTVQKKCLLLATAQQLQQSPSAQTPMDFPFDVTTARVVAECLQSKLSANRRSGYIKSLSGYLERFTAGHEAAPISWFTTGFVENFIAQFKNPDSRATWLNRISTLFSYAVFRGYLTANPCDKIERVTIDRKPPVIFTPEQVRMLLAVCPTICKPWLILAVFAGIRPDREMHLLKWEHINLETGTVQILFPKVRKHRRIVPLVPLAVELLRQHPLKKGMVAPSHSTIRRFKRKMRKALGFARWPTDVTRHTAASYLLAKDQDAAKVALWLGNSVSVLMSHYIVPVSAADCEEFWKQEKTAHRMKTAGSSPIAAAKPITAANLFTRIGVQSGSNASRAGV
jgi:integrase